MAEIADNKIHHGHNLFLLRKQDGLKQETVALAYGCKQNRISQLENQETISDDVLEWFANYYGVTLENILEIRK
ncbi:MAG: helix-turn-helix domain-containing protein [Prevotellaceae bacterium]|jgi:transcriptional regulator with XRE-family HTH domain|nr:helix-turn-helix domain-containing protein [Prevotellaceae bacterium]